MRFKDFTEKNREILQLIYGITLIIVIPSIFIYNSFRIIKEYNTNIDAALHHEALSVGRSIYALIQDDLLNEASLQNKIEKTSKRNSQIISLEILKPENDSFKIVASSKKDEVGKNLSFQFYKMAWTIPEDNNGIAIDSLKFATTAEDAEQLEGLDLEERYWLVALPMKDNLGNKQSLLAIKLSSKTIDELTKENRNKSIYFLVIYVLVIMLFLAAAVRLWDYALLYRKIKEVDQMKDEFISIASHELRTPVTSIRGFASMILDGTFGKVNEKVNTNLKIIKSSSERLAFLVEDLLNVSRIEQGRLKISKKPTDVGQIMKETITELKVQSDEKKLKLTYKPHVTKLPLISIDSERFKQVLINLIGNAIKYTEKGLVEITTEIKNNKTLEFKIKDTGIGMSSVARERLFQKFYRIQNEKTREITGTGLGLWITKKIITLMDGKIMVDSIEGSGTQVTLHFPIVKK